MLYHFRTRDQVPGGLFGVDVFFALSGFLITSLLVSESLSTGRIDLGRFYSRRVLRIMPALLAFLGVYLAISLAFHPSTEAGTLTSSQALRAVGFAVTQGFSWAVCTGELAPGGFIHLWSLSVEEQFYLVWPVLVWALVRGGVRPSILLLLAAILALLSATLPMILHWHTDEAGWR